MHEIGVSVIWLSLQVTVVAVCSALMYYCVRRQGPLLRSLVISSSMFITLLLAALIFSPWPRWSNESREQSSIQESKKITIPEVESDNEAVTTVVSSTPDTVSIELESVWSSAWGGFLERLKKAPPVTDQKDSLSWPAMIGFLFLGGMALGIIRLCFGYVLLQREVRLSTSLEGTAAQELLNEILIKDDNRSAIRLLQTQRFATAAVVGWWRPVILLPDVWQTWSLDQLRAVLMHEMAHINQRDFLSNVCAEINRSIHFYHPLMHWLVARLRLEQELAADAAAAKSTGGTEPYLIILAEMAMESSNRRMRGPARAFLPTRSTFLRRIDVLNDKTSFKGTVSRSARIVAVVAVLLVGMLAIGIRGDGVSIAQDAATFTQGSSSPMPAAGEVENKKLEKFPINFVPNNALAVVAIRPAKILAQKSMEPVRDLLKEKIRNSEPFNILGLSLEEMETVTLIIHPDTIKVGMFRGYIGVIQVGQDIDLTTEATLTSILKKFSGVSGKIKFSQLKIGGKTHTKVTSSNNEALLFLNERTLIVATNEKYLQLIIDTIQQGTVSRWAKQWKAIETDSVAAILNLRQARELVWKKQLKFRVEDTTVWGFIYPIWENTDLISLGIMMDGKISLKSTLYQVQNGAKIKKTLEAPLTLAQNMLAMSKQNIGSDKSKERVEIMSLINIGEKLAQSVEIKQNGEDVTLTASVPGNSVIQAVATGLIPAIKQAREAARRTLGKNNLKQIMLALHNYHDANKHFPPAVVMGPDGKTPHSWRVELLPYLGLKTLYDEYKLNEPWNSENNKKVLAKMPSVFRNPNDKGAPSNTSYFAVVGKNTAFGKISASNKPGADTGAFGGEDLAAGAGGRGTDGGNKGGGVRLRDITDGTSNTIAVVEAKRDIPWTKPVDVQYDGKQLPKFGGFHQGGYFVGLCDGSVRFVSENINPETLKILLEINDGKPLPGY